MLTFPEQKRAGRRMLAGRTLLKNTQAPTDQGNGRAGRTAELPLHVLHGFQGRRRTWGARQMGNLRRRPEATTAHGADARQRRKRQQQFGRATARGAEAFHPSIPKNRHGRARRADARLFRSARCPGAFASLRGPVATAGPRWRSGPFCAMLRLRRSAARNAEGQPPGHRRPGRSREKLSTKLPA